MKTKKPTVKKVTSTGSPKLTVSKGTGVPKSRFADKDFDFNKFPSQKKKYRALTDEEMKLIYNDGKPLTIFPYEIDGDPVIQGATKWQAMCAILGLALLLTTYLLTH
jgi:hypothetical protein